MLKDAHLPGAKTDNSSLLKDVAPKMGVMFPSYLAVIRATLLLIPLLHLGVDLKTHVGRPAESLIARLSTYRRPEMIRNLLAKAFGFTAPSVSNS